MKTYIGDEAALTGHLTPEEFGCYERLRRHYWQHGGLPDDDARLIRITGVDADRWEAIRSGICDLFDEGWRLPRLDHERDEAAAKRVRAIERSQKALEARWKKNASSNPSSTATSNAYGMRQGMQQGMLEQCPPAPAPDEVRLGGKVSSYAGARTRETEPTEYAIDPPETVEQGRRFLEGRHVPPQDMEAKLTKLMAFRLYPSELEPYRRSAA
jgi:uncharacterized protein YdaU (DUF1376 family)